MDIKTRLTTTPKEKPMGKEDLGFGNFFTDHMFTMDYEEGEGWKNATIQPYAPLAIDPAAMVLHYGQAVFEGMKCYRGEGGKILLFRPERNFERLNTSDDRLCIPYIPVEDALEALMALIKQDKDWIPTGAGETLYIRPFTIATEGALGVRPSNNYKFIIILSPVGQYYPTGLAPTKIMIESEYVRAVKGGLGFTKATANYASSLKAQVKAKDHGYTQVLWLDGVHRKYIEEVGTTNVFFKIGGEFITPPLEGSILPGITRDSVIKLLQHWGLPIIEKSITVEELYKAHEDGKLEEAFATGTAGVVSPIGEFNWTGKKITVASGDTGEYTKKIYDELTGIQFGRKPDPFGWVKVVEG